MFISRNENESVGISYHRMMKEIIKPPEKRNGRIIVKDETKMKLECSDLFRVP